MDSSFGVNGKQTTDFVLSDQAWTLLLEEGKIVAVGNSNTETQANISLARYLGDPQEKYVHIKKWLHRHGFTWDDCPDWLCNNLNYYKVERSASGNSFTEITKIFKGQQQNSFEDAAPLSGTNYYRLAAVSTDGSVAYSNVIAIDGDETSVKLYPNPVKNNLHVAGLSATQKTKLTIVDFMGNIKAIQL